jgi:hypothetical protein
LAPSTLPPESSGLGNVYQVFGEKLPALLDELNEVLAA